MAAQNEIHIETGRFLKGFGSMDHEYLDRVRRYCGERLVIVVGSIEMGVVKAHNP
jgi:hypothetical protein